MLKKVNIKQKGIIFDFDDTIANTKTGKNMGLRIVSFKIYDYLRKKGININFNKLNKEIRNMAQKMVAQKICDRNLWWSSIIKKFLKEKPSKNFLDVLTRNYWKMVIKKGMLYKDTLSVLVYLKKKGYLLGLLTDTDGVKGLKSKRIKALSSKKWFDVIIIGGEDIKQTKPAKNLFSLFPRKLNLRPQECIFVGNDLYLDIFGAKRVGMTTIFINRHSSKMRIKPDKKIKTLSELKEIL